MSQMRNTKLQQANKNFCSLHSKHCFITTILKMAAPPRVFRLCMCNANQWAYNAARDDTLMDNDVASMQQMLQLLSLDVCSPLLLSCIVKEFYATIRGKQVIGNFPLKE